MPTNQAELQAAAPTTGDYAELATGTKPLIDAGKMLYNYGKTALQGAHEAGQEIGEAGTNIAEGGPVGANIGKAAGGVLHGALSAVPFVGAPLEQAGVDVHAGNYAGTIGGMLGVLAQIEGPHAVDEVLQSRAVKLAETNHASAEAQHNIRVKELDTHLNQAQAASAAADQAVAAEQAGTGTRQQTIDAKNYASEAAAQAKKSQQALAEATVAKNTAAYERDKVVRKTVDDVQKSKPVVDQKQTKAQAGALEDSMKSAPPAANGPAAYTVDDAKIARGYEEQEHAKKPVTTIQGRAEALQNISDRIDDRVGEYVQDYANEPISTNVNMDVRGELAKSPKADFVEKGMAELENWNLTDPSMAEAQKLVTDLNAENRATLKKNFWDVATALKVDPAFAARQAALDSLRKGIDGTLVDHGVDGVRQLRNDQASIIRVKSAVEKQALNGDQVVRGSGQAGRLRNFAARSADKVGAVGGGISGGVAGAAYGPAASVYGIISGARMGEELGRWVGKKIQPGDVTRDALIERSNKTTGAGRAITDIKDNNARPSNPPGFPTPPAPTDALSQRDILQIQREQSPLHGELATHLNKSVNDPKASYAALEKQFMDDYEDKVRNGVKIEPADKQLFGKINQQDLSDNQAVQKMQQEQAEKVAAGQKLLPTATLPENAEPAMQMRGRMQKGMNTQNALVHDMAHAVVADEIMGDKLPSLGINSHLHPENAGTSAVATAAFDWSKFVDEDGNMDPKKFAPAIDDLATVFVSGGIANDLFHDIPFTENHHLGADLHILRRLMNAIDIDKPTQQAIVTRAGQRAAEILSRPGVEDVLHEHAAVREPGLDSHMHVSPERMQQIIQDVKGGDNEVGNEPASGNGKPNRNPEQGAEERRGKGAAEGAKAATKDDVGKVVGKEREGSAEGTGKETGSKQAEGIKPVNPSLEEKPELTHRKTPQGGEVSLDSEQNGLIKNRGWLTYANEGDTAHVRVSDMDQAFRGQGHGQKMYERAADEARANGSKVLASDVPDQMSTDAVRVWDKLSEKHPGEIEKTPTGYRWNLEAKPEIKPENPALSDYQVPTRKHLSTPDEASNPGATVKTMQHELGHYMVGHNEGLEAKGILRHTHPDVPSGTNAAVSWDTSILDQNTGRVKPEKVPSVVRMAMGGIAQDEILGIPRAENRNFNTKFSIGDGRLARKILHDAGYTPEQIEPMLHQAIDDAKAHLTKPAVSDILRENAGTRENGLSNQYHYSPERLKAMGDEAARRIANEPNNGAAITEGGRGRAENVAGREGEAQGAVGQGVPKEGIKPENPALSNEDLQRGLKETTTGNPDHDQMIRNAGGIPAGNMGGKLPLYHDPTSGSTLATEAHNMSEAEVRRNLHESRAAFAPQNAVAEQAKSGGFSFNPKDGSVPKDGYMVETHLDRGKDLGHPPTTDDIKQFIADNKDVLDKNPNLHVGGWGNTLGISERIADQDAAIKAGTDRNQKAIFDVKSGKDIQTGGTGAVPIKPANPALSKAQYPENPEGFENIHPDLLKSMEPDEKEFVKGDKRKQTAIEKSYNDIKPTIDETKAAMQAGGALGGWWQRFMDTFKALGEPTEAAKIEQLGPEHAEALKAWHSAVSGNKSVSDANRTAWGTYADWLDQGRPKDRESINKIVAANGKPKGNAAISDTIKNGKVINKGLDTTKLHSLINSPQMRDVNPEPFHGGIFNPNNPSPIAGVSNGARKIPSMGATVAGEGNLNRLVLDAHMLDFYGENGWTDNKYIAHSIHLRQAAEELGLKAGEGQEQIWGTVLGIKKLLREGVPTSDIPHELTNDVVNSIGKDYADIIREDPELNTIFEQLKKHGIDPGGTRAQSRLAEITNKPAVKETGANQDLLTNVAERIKGRLKNLPEADDSSFNFGANVKSKAGLAALRH
jgi:predicted GNAT family acetyltransferase